MTVGGKVAYAASALEPYLSATYSCDLSSTDLVVSPGAQPSNDRDDVLLGAGVRFFAESAGLSGQAEVTTRLGRDDIGETVVAASVRWEF